MPEPAQNRLANRHEYIIHLVPCYNYYYDLFGYSREVGNGANPGDVWRINPGRHMGKHLAPFPTEIVRSAILLACPYTVCGACGAPRSASCVGRPGSTQTAHKHVGPWNWLSKPASRQSTSRRSRRRASRMPERRS